MSNLCLPRLSPDAFYVPAHKIVYKLLLEFREESKPADFYLLKQVLEDRDLLDEVGGKEFLNHVYAFIPTAANARYYINLVREKYLLRQLILTCRNTENRCYVNSEDLELLFDEARKAIVSVATDAQKEPKRAMVEFLSPSQITAYIPPSGALMVGDNHITRGSVVVIGGASGVGKSRAAVALAEAGATGREWFGLKIHSRFKTLILQNEHGRFRLKQEFSDLPCDTMDQCVRVTPPPPFGLRFEATEFRQELAAAIDAFGPDVIVIDPWNQAARDEKARNMLETFDLIRTIIPAGDEAPAIAIVAHTRKPQVGERSSGRALLNLLAGSYVLGSVPRCVFVMQAASDDVVDDRIVWTCCKNNDGELGPRSAWQRCNGPFHPISDFNWDAFDHPDGENGITELHLRTVFESGPLSKAAAVDRLKSITGRGKTQCYEALRPDGKFGEHLSEQSGKLAWI